MALKSCRPPATLFGGHLGLAASAKTQDTHHRGGDGEYEQQPAEEFHRRCVFRGANWSRTNDLILIRDAL